MNPIVGIILVFLILVVSISYIIYNVASWIVYYKRKTGYQNKILNPLYKALFIDKIKNLDDIHIIIKNSRIEPYFNNPDIYFDEVLCDMYAYYLKYNTKDDKSELFNSLFGELKKRNETKPFDGLPEEEKILMLDVMALIKTSDENLSLLKSKFDSLSKILNTKERSMQVMGADNKYSLRLSKVSLYVGIFSMLISIFSIFDSIFGIIDLIKESLK